MLSFLEGEERNIGMINKKTYLHALNVHIIILRNFRKQYF